MWAAIGMNIMLRSILNHLFERMERYNLVVAATSVQFWYTNFCGQRLLMSLFLSVRGLGFRWVNRDERLASIIYVLF